MTDDSATRLNRRGKAEEWLVKKRRDDVLAVFIF
jgi:hypothetical protein